MSDTRSKPRHRRRRTVLLAGAPLAVAAAAALAYGGGFLGADGADSASAATAETAAAWADDTADGFASVDAQGQDGTYGGRGGETVTVRNLADLEKYATASKPYVIVVAGEIKMDPVGKEIKVASDKTIVGAGTAGHIVGGGFFLGTGVHNVIIRNLTIRDSYQGTWNDKDHDFDAIQMDGAHHVWIDHNDLRRMADGLIDVRKDSTDITVSWNKLSNDNKAFGIGWTENVVTDITIHHNWIRETEQRNPSTDNAAHAHLYNNYLQDDAGTDITSSYGNYSRGKTKMVLENSYFQGVNNPVIKDDTATLVQRGSVFSGTSGRNESGGTAFTPSDFYDYTLDKAADVPGLLKSGVGPRSSIGTASATAETKAAASTLTVAADGSAQYKTVQAAVDAVPANNTARVDIKVAPGTYRGTVTVPANKPHVTIVGTGSSRKSTVLVEGHAAGTKKPDGSTYGTSGSATVTVLAADTQLRNLSVSNDYDESKDTSIAAQAVALRTSADKVFLDSVITSGDQDTLLLDGAGKRVYMKDSYVVGNVDFIFGGATAVIDQSVITLKKRWDGTSAGYVMAPSTAAGKKGLLVNRTTISGDVSADSFHLGRNWHAGGDASLDPQATVRNSTLGAAIKAKPWTDMGGFSWKDDRFAEYKNTGDGAGSASADRPQLSDAQAAEQEVADWLGDWTPTAS
ncbi:pectinesterase family protein [Streptomyces sp. NBC_01016]|uniref:pectinesterase family protein n=1 Tax=Streptomyces sp. NBC_01016 TaxID=2903720 RepID=UPI002259C0CA|nr:pectinesterase family protein [Streptomyces sp. NBC_01016]MCX4830578.1 pectinesterase family protein [Streptomyces sp. NBC_01016]